MTYPRCPEEYDKFYQKLNNDEKKLVEDYVMQNIRAIITPQHARQEGVIIRRINTNTDQRNTINNNNYQPTLQADSRTNAEEIKQLKDRIEQLENMCKHKDNRFNQVEIERDQFKEQVAAMQTKYETLVQIHNSYKIKPEQVSVKTEEKTARSPQSVLLFSHMKTELKDEPDAKRHRSGNNFSSPS